MKGIATEYKGYRFRSKLEARWARFFDWWGWQWEYEPIELGGWIPDFAIRRAGISSPLLVEVKPIMAFDESLVAKIDHADRAHEVLLLGLGPAIVSSHELMLGWLRECFNGDCSWGCAMAGVWDKPERGPGSFTLLSQNGNPNPRPTLGICHEFGSYEDRITGSYSGNSASFYGAPEVMAMVLKSWAYTQQEFQWMGRPT